MTLPTKVLNRLRLGQSVAAELAQAPSEMRAYVVVIPQAPSVREHPEAWNEGAWENRLHAEPRLRDPAMIHSYEVRYLLHHARYTNAEWGLDYDYVLDDATTRVKRVFVECEEQIEVALAVWLPDISALQHPGRCDSSLVNSPIDYYLNRPDERPHLWQE